MIYPICYLLLIGTAEFLTVYLNPVWGVIAHLLILAGLIVHSALSRDQKYQYLFLSMALVPLIRIVSLSIPLSAVPRLWWYPIIYAPLLAAGFVVMRIQRLPRIQVGLVLPLKQIPVQALIAMTGVVIGIVEYYILRPDPSITALTWQALWLPTLIFILTTGFVEEFLFRGIMQRNAFAAVGWKGIIFIAAIFAIVHMGFKSWIDVGFVFMVALGFGWLVKKTGSLVGVTLSHGIANSVLYLIAPFILG